MTTDNSSDRQATNDDAQLITEAEFSVLLSSSDDPSVDRPAPQFTNADRIAKGQFQNLDVVNERLCRKLKEHLFTLLRREVEVSQEPQKVMRFCDYQASLPVPTNLNMVTVPQLSCQGLVTVEGDLVGRLTDLFYGGSGMLIAQRREQTFTPTEKRLTEILLDHVLAGLAEAWEPLFHLDWKKDKAESNPHFVNMGSPSERILVSSFRLDGGACQGSIHVVLPMEALASIGNVLSSTLASDRQSQQALWRATLESGVRKAEVELRAVLGQTQVTLGELLSLKAGDVLKIELPPTAAVYVADSHVFTASFGVHKGFNAVRLVERVEKDADDKAAG